MKRKETTDAELFKFGNRAFKEVAEDFDVYFFGEIEITEAFEARGPRFIIEFEVVDLGVSGEQAAVKGVNDWLHGAAFIDGAKEAEEIVPTGIADTAEGGKGVGSALKALFGKKFAVFTEGDKDDAVEKLLSDADCNVERLFLRKFEIFDEAKSLALVGLVKIVADFFLALLSSFEEERSARELADSGAEKAGAFKEAIELVEAVAIAEFLKGEFFVGEDAFGAVVETDDGKVGDDAPGAIGLGVEVIPALLDGGAAAGLVAVEIGHGTFKFYDDRWGSGGWEFAKGGIGSADTGNGEFVF